MSPGAEIWWGAHDIAVGSCGRWRIGPTALWIQRLHAEWRLATEPVDGSDELVEVEVPADPPDLLELDAVARFGMSHDGTEITLQPRLADRPVVTQPRKPFFVPPHESVVVFVGSPVWLALSLAGEVDPFHELPIARPADTWFGPPTDAGQLCYASRTYCRLRREQLPVLPHRALSRVRVINKASTAFLLERMQLPVEYLELYRGGDGALWSQDVELVHAEADVPAPMTIRRGAPGLAASAEHVAGARKHDGSNLLVGAFTALFR